MMNRYQPGMGMSGSRVQAQPMREAWKPAAPEQKKSGGGGGMLGGMMGGMGLSDRHSKEKIEKLSSTNDALMAALDDAHKITPEGNMPATEYPRMPSHTSFGPDPADKVAAQNVGIQAAQDPQQSPPQAAPAPQAMQMSPQQQNFAKSQNPAFNVGNKMPDLSALDEAYRRQGMGG